MSEGGRKRGFKDYLATLVATLLVPLLWLKALALARRHSDVDPRARGKVLVAMAASLAIGVVGFALVFGFLASARAGMYDSMDVRLADAVGETEYQEQQGVITTAQTAIPKIEANLANATDPAQRALLSETLNTTRRDLESAQHRVGELQAHHAHYQRIHDAVQAQDDAEVRDLLASAPEYEGSDEAAANAFAVKERSLDDMRLFAWLFLWPSLVGAFFAPLAFAFGSILARAFEPSDSVGFKPYPGAAAGLFLLFGAFGIPALFFAAWTFHDAFGRSEEGQIAL